MARIMIDGRFYGTEHTGLGRYTKNIIDRILKTKSNNQYVVLVNTRYLSLPHQDNATLVECNIRHYSLMEQIVIPFLVVKYRVDKLYTLHFNAPIFARVQTIVTIHDLIKTHFSDITTSTHGFLMYKLKRLGYQLVMWLAIKKARRIIVPTNAVKNDILTIYPKTDHDKIVRIYEAVDDFVNTQIKILPNKKSNVELLYVGNSYPHKNLLGLLQAFTLLIKEGDYHLTLLTRETPYLKKIFASLNKPTLDRITRIEVVSDQKLQVFYSQSDVLITPSFMEGFGLPALEALSVGTRVVASDIPVYREVYKNHVTYCNPFDPTSIKDAIKEAMQKPKERYTYPRSWDQVAKDILKVIS